jgi:hypothetical protein
MPLGWRIAPAKRAYVQELNEVVPQCSDGRKLPQNKTILTSFQVKLACADKTDVADSRTRIRSKRPNPLSPESRKYFLEKFAQRRFA